MMFRPGGKSMFSDRTGLIGRFSESKTQPTEIDLHFKFPTTEDVFLGGGGDFHHECNTSVESPCEAQISITNT